MHMIINVVEERNNYKDLKLDMRKLECLVCLKFLSSDIHKNLCYSLRPLGVYIVSNPSLTVH